MFCRRIARGYFSKKQIHPVNLSVNHFLHPRLSPSQFHLRDSRSSRKITGNDASPPPASIRSTVNRGGRDVVIMNLGDDVNKEAPLYITPPEMDSPTKFTKKTIQTITRQLMNPALKNAKEIDNAQNRNEEHISTGVRQSPRTNNTDIIPLHRLTPIQMDSSLVKDKQKKKKAEEDLTLEINMHRKKVVNQSEKFSKKPHKEIQALVAKGWEKRDGRID
ncbi:hypothetical protein LXL04_016077 [Taraxacum kok-saghyz]